MFVAICLASAGTYYWNDILDLEADRAHPTKSRRPIAAGAIPLGARPRSSARRCSSPASALGVRCPTGRPASSCSCYVALTLTYSMFWKHIAVVDLVAVAGGFVLRAIAGAYAADVPMRSWFVLCTRSPRCSSSPASATRSCASSATTPRRRGRRSTSTARLPAHRDHRVSLGATLVAYCLWAFETMQLVRQPHGRSTSCRSCRWSPRDALHAHARAGPRAARRRRSSSPTACCRCSASSGSSSWAAGCTCSDRAYVRRECWPRRRGRRLAVDRSGRGGCTPPRALPGRGDRSSRSAASAAAGRSCWPRAAPDGAEVVADRPARRQRPRPAARSRASATRRPATSLQFQRQPQRSRRVGPRAATCARSAPRCSTRCGADRRAVRRRRAPLRTGTRRHRRLRRQGRRRRHVADPRHVQLGRRDAGDRPRLLVAGGRFRYVGRSRVARRVPRRPRRIAARPGAQRVRQVAQLPWFARNLARQGVPRRWRRRRRCAGSGGPSRSGRTDRRDGPAARRGPLVASGDRACERDQRSLLTGWGGTNPTSADADVRRPPPTWPTAVKEHPPRGVHRPRSRPRVRRRRPERRRAWCCACPTASPTAVLDEATGTVTCGAGVSIDDLLRVIVPRGLLRPGDRRAPGSSPSAAPSPATSTARTTTSTARSAATCTGCRCCSPTASVVEIGPDRDPELFWATVGGMGLTGVILDATFDLIPIETSRCVVDTTRGDRPRRGARADVGGRRSLPLLGRLARRAGDGSPPRAQRAHPRRPRHASTSSRRTAARSPTRSPSTPASSPACRRSCRRRACSTAGASRPSTRCGSARRRATGSASC